MNKSLNILVLLVGLAPILVSAAPREANRDGAALAKLQALVKSMTSERDAAKAETAKLTEEMTQLKSQQEKDKVAAESVQAQLSNDLAMQKASTAEVSKRLQDTHARLLEVIEKHKQVTESKAVLSNELDVQKNSLALLTAKQKTTEEQLATCGSHNVKLYQSAKELLERYQHKGTWATLLDDEPVLQFQSVEMENIVQDYQDKLNSGKYKTPLPSN